MHNAEWLPRGIIHTSHCHKHHHTARRRPRTDCFLHRVGAHAAHPSMQDIEVGHQLHPPHTRHVSYLFRTIHGYARASQFLFSWPIMHVDVSLSLSLSISIGTPEGAARLRSGWRPETAPAGRNDHGLSPSGYLSATQLACDGFTFQSSCASHPRSESPAI